MPLDALPSPGGATAVTRRSVGVVVGGLEGAFIAITITRLNNRTGILGDHTPSRELPTNKITPTISDRGAGGGGGAWGLDLSFSHHAPKEKDNLLFIIPSAKFRDRH